MTANRDVVLMSIRSPHVERILDGTKTVELRRRALRLEPGTTVLVYAAATRRELVGAFDIGGIDAATPERLWRRHRTATGISKAEFSQYFDSAPIAYAVTATRVRELPEPIPLEELRRRWPYFTAPQTHRRVTANELTHLLNGERQILIP